MTTRMALVTFMLVSTIAFVIGVSVERSEGEIHPEAPAAAEAGEAGAEHTGEEAGSEETHAEEHTAEAERGERDELLGIDLEATPFVVLAAGFSLALALAVWLGVPWAPLLLVVAVAMAVFAVFDVREVLHQIDESKAGLALLAAFVAAMHLGASAIAARGDLAA